jgi:predicted small metal-binding protein
MVTQAGIFPHNIFRILKIHQVLGGLSASEGKMLYRYSCKDMGLNCPFVMKGETMEEVTRKALDHILEAHLNDFNTLTTAVQKEEMRKALGRSMRVVAG